MDILYITFTGVIDDASVAQLMQAFNEISMKHRPKEIYLLLSSPGGNINAGIKLYNFLRGLPIKLTTHNIGQIDSIGNVIFLAGEDRFMAPATSFLFHGVSLDGQGQFRFSRNQLRELMSQFEQDEKRISTIVCERTKLTATRVDKFYDIGESLGSDEAINVGLVSEVKLPSIPADAESLFLLRIYRRTKSVFSGELEIGDESNIITFVPLMWYKFMFIL